ncbi:metal-dependent hydrolase [Tersicoccus solisilvae]|uniref:Metal-dependent hydrolase n=1 Tax=Tersicoccus solisilvae TaxID=1882339 RepID=A0ABQ1NYT4_9MICC|nr:M48 family metallopeptidase [Tersicoccus solisilvae]GGC87845.1 metal-dependent hydrolase [Tersicoccus solisilvae]
MTPPHHPSPNRTPAPTPGPAGEPADPPVEVRRSAKRRRTISAVWRDGRIVVSVPASGTPAQERAWVATMVARLTAQRDRQAAEHGPGGLAARAEALSGRYLGGRARPVSVRWVANQSTRWGSATPSRGTIRLSTQLQGMPDWVVDYVLLHELAHLIEPGHGPRFQALLAGYPRLAEARAFLEGASFAARRGLTGEHAED